MQWSLALVVVMSSFFLAFFVIPELIALANKIKFNFIANEQLTGYNGSQISSLVKNLHESEPPICSN